MNYIMRYILISGLWMLANWSAIATEIAPKDLIVLRADSLLEVVSGKLVYQPLVFIEGDRILKVVTGGGIIPNNATIIELPGPVSYTHLTLPTSDLV